MELGSHKEEGGWSGDYQVLSRLLAFNGGFLFLFSLISFVTTRRVKILPLIAVYYTPPAFLEYPLLEAGRARFAMALDRPWLQIQ